ncbi:MAG TPA: hypothetical protein VN043_13415 [Rhodanobacter sp.]|nr:hypothetical protein [Rhodanobacter sp.]
MYKFPLRTAVLALALSTAFAAHASDSDFSYRFSGFGTVGYTETNSNDVTLTNPGQFKGADKSGSTLLDSRIGGQLDLTFSPKLSATVQAIAMQNQKGKFKPQLEWAFLRYKLSNDVSARVGQLGFPAYLVSDFRYVGYANPWVRAPLEVYGLAALDSYQGADLTWSHSAGTGYLTVQGLAGHASSPAVDNGTLAGRIKVNQLAGAYVTYEIGNLRIRGGASTGKVSYITSGTKALIGGLEMAGMTDTVNAIDADSARTTFMNLGGTYDANNILAMVEYAKLNSASLIGHSQGWYGTFGYRLGKVMPYVSYAGYNKQDDRSMNHVPAMGPLIPLAAAVDGQLMSDNQRTASLGVRWDVYKNIAIKAQYDHVSPSQRGGTFSHVDSAYNGHPVNVYSTVVDFVF